MQRRGTDWNNTQIKNVHIYKNSLHCNKLQRLNSSVTNKFINAEGVKKKVNNKENI